MQFYFNCKMINLIIQHWVDQKKCSMWIKETARTTTYADITQLERAELKGEKILNYLVFVRKKSRGFVLG